MRMFTQRWPIEALLRPIHEYTPAFAYAVTVLVLLVYMESAPVTRDVALMFIGAYSLRGLYRFLQGRVPAHYQRGLWRYAPFNMDSRKLPVSTKGVYLGDGFRWDDQHTQRMADLDSQSYYGRPSSFYRAARAFELRHERTPVARHIASLLGSPSILNPVRPSGPPNDIGNPNLHGVGSIEGSGGIYLAKGQRSRHLAIMGTTGVGKTECMNNLIAQDIALGHVTIVFDPKGDKAVLAGMYEAARLAGKEDDFHILHLGFPEQGSGYSPIATFSRITEVATRIAEQLPGEGESRAFRAFVWRLVNLIAAAMFALGQTISYRDVLKYGQNIDPLAQQYLDHHLEMANHRDGAWRGDVAAKTKASKADPTTARLRALVAYYQRFQIDDPIADSLIKVVEADRGYQDKLVGSLLPLMEKLTSGLVADMLSPDYDDPSRRIFSFPELIRAGGILYVGLDSMADSEVSNVVCGSMFSDLTSTLAEIYKYGVEGQSPTIAIYIDEVGEAVNDPLVQLLNKGRGANANITIGAQTAQDLEVGFGDKARAEQAFGNINSFVMLAAKNVQTAELLVTKLGEAMVVDQMLVASNRDDGSAFAVTTEQRTTQKAIEKIIPAHVASLPTGEAFVLMNGNEVFKIKIPLVRPKGRAEFGSVAEVFDLEHERREREAGPTVRADVPISIGSSRDDAPDRAA